jgi:translation elongation factor EF-G
MKDKKETAQILRDHRWEPDVAKKVMRFDSRGNVMINGTRGVQFVDESSDSLLSGFDEVMTEGGLTKEQDRDCKFTFTHFVPHEDTAHRGLSQLGPASRRACLAAFLSASPMILEPMLAIEVRVPTDLIGNVSSVLQGKRGKVLDMQQKGATSIVIGEVPAVETFDISEKMRGQTAGKAMWNTHFKAAVCPLIFSDISNVSTAGTSPITILVAPFCCISSTFPRFPCKTLETLPIRSVGTRTSIASIGSRIIGLADKNAAKHALLDAGPSCDNPL